MEILIIWVLMGLVAGFIAANKGRNGLAWSLLGMVGGVFALIAIAAVPAIKTEE